MLCYAMLYYAMLCYATLYYTMQCYAILSYVLCLTLLYSRIDFLNAKIADLCIST